MYQSLGQLGRWTASLDWTFDHVRYDTALRDTANGTADMRFFYGVSPGIGEGIDIDTLGFTRIGSTNHIPAIPIGFGSDEKAEKYFKKALAINPQGLDINYFFAEYLADNGEDQLALEYIDKALQAPRMAERPVADAGRREQALRLRESLLGS